MTTDNWITLISVAFSAVLGYFVKYLFDKKAQFSSSNAEIKRNMYEEHIDFIFKLLDQEKDLSEDATKIQNEETVKKLKEFHKKAVMYASPRVFKAYSDLMQCAYKENAGESNGLNMIVHMTNLFKEVRKEIGLSNRGLRSGGIRLMRPQITDYDSKIKPLEVGLLSKAKIKPVVFKE